MKFKKDTKPRSLHCIEGIDKYKSTLGFMQTLFTQAKPALSMSDTHANMCRLLVSLLRYEFMGALIIVVDERELIAMIQIVKGARYQE